MIDARKGQLLADCNFLCVDHWLSDSIQGKISDFFMRPQCRAIRQAEETGDVHLLDPFEESFNFEQDPSGLGPVLFRAEDDRRRIDCDSAEVLKQRLDQLTKGLVSKLASIDGILIAGGSVVDALIDGSGEMCTDLDIFLECAPHQGMSKLRAIYEGCRAVALSMSQGGSVRNLFVTRTTCSVTIFLCSNFCLPPVQVVLHTVASVKELLARFDVDVCAVCYEPSSGRVYMTPRSKRAFEFGANVMDSRFNTVAYTKRLYKCSRGSD